MPQRKKQNRSTPSNPASAPAPHPHSQERRDDEDVFTLLIPSLTEGELKRLQVSWIELVNTPTWKVCAVDMVRMRAMHARDLIVTPTLTEYQRGFYAGRIQELTYLLSMGKRKEREYQRAKQQNHQ